MISSNLSALYYINITIPLFFIPHALAKGILWTPPSIELGAFMRTEFLCISVLIVASGPRVKSKLAGRKSALNTLPPLPDAPHPRWFILQTVLRRWSRCYSLLLYGSFYEAICFKSCLVLLCSCVFQPFKHCDYLTWGRELTLVLFVRLFDLRLFGFVCFLFLFVSGKGCGLWL